MKFVKVEERNLVANVLACMVTQNTFTERFYRFKTINGKNYWVYLMTNKQYRKWAKSLEEHRLI